MKYVVEPFSNYREFNVFFLAHIILFEDEREGKGNVWVVLNGAIDI
jgi:hypothetical protein